jgi:hypothetical protein
VRRKAIQEFQLNYFCETEALTAAAMTITIFCDVTPCSLRDCSQLFGGTCWLGHGLQENGSRFLRNVGNHLPHYTMSLNGKQSFSLFLCPDRRATSRKLNPGLPSYEARVLIAGLWQEVPRQVSSAELRRLVCYHYLKVYKTHLTQIFIFFISRPYT